MVKLSIIVPIYNVEQYLRKCIDSLLNQDIPSSEYEIILVDDGGYDRCPQICDEYARMNETIVRDRSRKELENEGIRELGKPFIKVIHRENGGLSAARNSGIEVAQGEYVMFVDSDDYIEPNVLNGLIEQVERDNLDVLRFRLQYVNPQYEVYNPYKSDPFKGNDFSKNPTDGITFLSTRMSTACYAWAFVIKRELLDGCIFTPGIYFEDTDWTPRMLSKAKRVASTETVVYNYLQREGSITNAVNRSKQKKVLDDKVHLIVTLQQQAEELSKSGRYNRWYRDMISDLVVSIITMLGVDFYDEKEAYLMQLQELHIYPLQPKSLKAKLINISPKCMVKFIHLKNKK